MWNNETIYTDVLNTPLTFHSTLAHFRIQNVDIISSRDPSLEVFYNLGLLLVALCFSTCVSLRLEEHL